MSINITDKVGDNVETLVDNTNEAIVTVNNQLDSSVLANLTTEVKDTLVNAINEINQKKFNKTDNYIPNDLSIGGKLIADQVVLSIDEDNNSSVYFYDTTNKAHIKLFWNNNLRKWQLSFPDGKIVDIANSDDLNNIQIQIDEAIASINYDFNTNVKPLIFKQLPANEINEYTGSAGEIVLNSSDWSEIRVHDGVTKGGVIVSGGSTVVNWEPNIEIKKDQCVYYGNGLYRSKSKHTTGNNFDIDLYDVLASYKKIVEKQTTSEKTDTITLHQAITDKKELDINIGGLIIQQDGYSIIDSYHIKLSEAIPANTDVEITYYKASNLLNSSIVINKYTVQNDDEKTIPLDNIVENHTLILQVNVENTVLLNDEWQLGENNSSIVLKNGLKSGDRVQIMFLKGVQVAQNGITFTPKVVNGVLSWSNDGGLDNPENISIVTTDTVQTINAKKTFNNIEVITKDVNDSSKAAANTEWVQNILSKSGGGLEIGDIGFAPLGVDETENKRRYLNGQVISQSQFVSFTNKLKSIVALYPNLATTEENWQAEVTNSKLGQCGKFVIDDTAGTIRLPKVVNLQSLQDLSLLGGIKAESLPNITGELKYSTYTAETTGVFSKISGSGSASSAQFNDYNAGAVDFDASRSSSTYQDNAPVQQEAVQYPYFIQVATGTEESVDVTREIELNNPFSLLDYKWSEYELNNASWLLSNGTFHSGTVYKAVYELLLKLHNGTETKDGVSVKLSTEAYEDTDFVLNTADTTFRLPIKVKLASGNAVVGNGMTLGLTDGKNNAGSFAAADAFSTNNIIQGYGYNVGQTAPSGGSHMIGNKMVGITTDPTKSGIETSSSGLKLYFYVGETIQDANVINASGVLTRVAELSDSYISGLGMPSDKYINLTIGADKTQYVAPANGYVCFSRFASATNQSISLYVDGITTFSKIYSSANNQQLVAFMPVAKGNKFNIGYSSSSTDSYLKFIYAEGDK